LDKIEVKRKTVVFDALHTQLETARAVVFVLDEDRSRVKKPNAALVLGMFRRVVVSFVIPWSQKK